MSTFGKCLIAIVLWAGLLLGGIAATNLESSMIEKYTINDPKGIARVMHEDRMAFHYLMGAADDQGIDRVKVWKAVEDRVVGSKEYSEYNLRTINLEIIYNEFKY